MDNFFTSLPLILQLQKENIYVLETVCLDRVPKQAINTLVEPKLLQRGSSSITTSSDNVTLVRWMDNKPVHTISLYTGAIPEDRVKRWNRSTKEYIEVTRPHSIRQYNKYMGGVDLVDRMVAHYPHGFKNKKCYLRVAFHLMNVAIVNAWHLYKIKKQQPKYPLLAFKASLAASYMTVGAMSKKRGRPPSGEGCGTPLPVKKRAVPPKALLEIRYDGKDHYPKKVETKQAPRCHERSCKSRTRYICGKCLEPVCPHCMEAFHRR